MHEFGTYRQTRHKYTLANIEAAMYIQSHINHYNTHTAKEILVSVSTFAPAKIKANEKAKQNQNKHTTKQKTKTKN